MLSCHPNSTHPMNWNVIVVVLQVIGSLSLFVYGMKVMSDAVQKGSGGQLRVLLRRLTRNSFNGIAFGSIFTGLIQSSSATTVMIISLVNAGLITVRQSVGLIMGANIGTTVTAWIVSLGGFLLKLSHLTLPILALAVPLYFRSNKKHQVWGEVALGFALLFIGLDFLKTSLPSLENQVVYDYIKGFMSYGLFSDLLFILIGLVITLLVQSSSASMTLTLAMTYNGWLPMELAAYMIIGENIGTCFTAEVAALVGNLNSRRSARIHTLFNVIGALLLFLFAPALLNLLEALIDHLTNQDQAFQSKEWSTIGLAAFHTLHNILTTVILLFFIPFILRIADWSLPKRIKDKTKNAENALALSELSPIEIQHQLLVQGKHIESMFGLIEEQFKSIDLEVQQSKLDEIKEHRNKVNELKVIVEDKTFKYSNSGSGNKIIQKVGTYFRISQNMTRAAGQSYNLGQYIKEKSENRTWLTPNQRTEIFKVIDAVQLAIREMIMNLNQQDYDYADLTEALKIEMNINNLRDKANQLSIENKDEFDFNLAGTMLFIRMISICENIGDRIIEVSRYMDNAE